MRTRSRLVKSSLSSASSSSGASAGRVAGILLVLGLIGPISLGACLLPDEHPASVTPPATTATDGGLQDTGTADVVSPPGQATQTGSVVDLDSKAGVEGATVDLGGKTGTTGAKGAYAIQVPLDTPYFMTVTGDGHLKLIEQEWKLSGDYDRLKTNFIRTSTSDTLRSTLPGYDSSKATISVGVVITGACKTEAGLQLAIDPPGDAKIKYFKGGFPSTLTATQADELVPTAVFWNIVPGDDYTIKVTSNTGTCTVVPYPYTDGKITYTGRVRGEAGDAASFIRLFLK